MKKLIVSVFGLLLVLAGCANETEEIKNLKNQIAQLTLEKDELLTTLEEERKTFERAGDELGDDNPAVILAQNIEEYPQSLYKASKLDLDEDGQQEQIELYVNAGKMHNGQFAWDDGQNWLLVIKDGNDIYPLFDEFVQLGSIDFTTTMLDGKPTIIMSKTQHTNRTVSKFTYNNEENGYQQEIFYKKENMNDQYNLPASYAFFEDAYDLMEVAFDRQLIAVLEASDTSLQQDEERQSLIEPVITTLYDAEQLLQLVGELNGQLYYSVADVLELLYQIVNDVPTAEQMEQLHALHEAFKGSRPTKLIIEDENKLQPEIVEKLHRFDSRTSRLLGTRVG